MYYSLMTVDLHGCYDDIGRIGRSIRRTHSSVRIFDHRCSAVGTAAPVYPVVAVG